MISAGTLPLLGGFFACQSSAPSACEAPPAPGGLSGAVGEYGPQSPRSGRQRWPHPARGSRAGGGAAAGALKQGRPTAVLRFSGEAGIGKSRLVQVLQAHVAAEPQAWLTPCQCSPYYRNTALYPMLDLLERVARRFARTSLRSRSCANWRDSWYSMACHWPKRSRSCHPPLAAAARGLCAPGRVA